MVEWRVVEGVCIAARDQSIALLAHQPVGHECAIPIAQYDPAGAYFRRTTPAHRQNVPRPDRGEHAGTGNSQATFSKSANDLRSEFSFDGMPLLFERLHGLGGLAVCAA